VSCEYKPKDFALISLEYRSLLRGWKLPRTVWNYIISRALAWRNQLLVGVCQH